MPLTSTRGWQYESRDERKQRELAEFDAISGAGLESTVDRNPLAPTRAAQTSREWSQREQHQEQAAATRQQTAERIRRQLAERQSGGVRGRLRTGIDANVRTGRIVGGAALEGLDRAREAGRALLTPADEGLGFAGSARQPLERAGRTLITGERHEDLDPLMARRLPGPVGAVAGRLADEVADPTNLVIALKGPAWANRLRKADTPVRKAAAALVEQIVPRTGPVSRIGQEATVAAGARGLGEAGVSALPEDAHPALQAGVGLGAGLTGGAGAALGLRTTAGGVRAGVRAGEDVALERALRDPRPTQTPTQRIRDALATRGARRRVQPVTGGAQQPEDLLRQADEVIGRFAGIREDAALIRATEGMGDAEITGLMQTLIDARSAARTATDPGALDRIAGITQTLELLSRRYDLDPPVALDRPPERFPVQGGLEGVARDRPTFRPEGEAPMAQGELGIGAGERPIDDLPMFDAARAEHPGAPPSVADTQVVPQRSVLTSDLFDSDALPPSQTLRARAEELAGGLTRGPDGRVRDNRANREAMRQIGELQAASEIRQAIDDAGGDVWAALDEIELRWQRVGEAVMAREAAAREGRVRGRRAAPFGSPERTAEDVGRRIDEARGLRTGPRRDRPRRAAEFTEELDVLRAQGDALDRFINTLGIDERTLSARPAQEAFADRYGISREQLDAPPPARETPAEEVARTQGEAMLRQAEEAGLSIPEQFAARIRRGDQIARRALGQQIVQTRRRVRGTIPLRRTVEEGRPALPVLRRTARETLEEIDLSDRRVVARLTEELGLRESLPPATVRRLDAGDALTQNQVQAIRRRAERAMEGMSEEMRQDILRRVVEGEPPPRPERSREIVPAERRRPGDSARDELPPEGTAARLASGDIDSTLPALRARDGSYDPPPPPRGPPHDGPDGHSGPRPDDPAYEMPDKGRAGIDEELRYADDTLLEEGPILRAVKQTVERVRQHPPGDRVLDIVEPVARGLARIANPATALGRKLHVAWNARRNTEARLATRFKGDALAKLRKVQEAWDANPPRYVGPRDNPYRGSIIDLASEPGFYRDVSPRLRAALDDYRELGLSMLREVRGNFDVEILPFRTDHPDFVYFPNVNGAEDALRALDTTVNRLVRNGRAKHRIHDSPYRRWREARRQGQTFAAVTDVDALAIHHAEALARMAANETFRVGSGGLTRIEVVDRLHPGLRQAKEAAARRIANIDGRMRTAMRQGRVEAARTRDIAGEMTRSEKRARPIIERLEELGYHDRNPEFGPEMSHLGGQLREIGLRWRQLRAELLRRGEKVADIEARHRDLLRDYEQSAQELRQLQRRYQAASTGEFVLSPHTFRYHPAVESRAIGGLMGRDLEENTLFQVMDHWRGMVVVADTTFATLHGLLATAMDPIVASRSGREVLSAMRDGEVLLRIQQREPRLVEEFARASGFQFDTRGGREIIGGEFARGKGVEAIPWFNIGPQIRRFNDAQWRAVVARVYDQWKHDRAALIEAGFSPDVASVDAAHVLWSAVPRMNPARTGRGMTRAMVERQVFISPSFLTQPFVLMKDAASGMVKMGLNRAGMHGEPWAALSARERLAVRRFWTLNATLMSLSVASAIASAPANNLSVEDAVLEVVNPASPRFLSIILGDQASIPLGSAYRSAFRAFAPRRTAEGEWDYMAGAVGFLRGKRHPAVAGLWDQIKGEDYFGNDIEEGVFKSSLANRLFYAAESGMPIWTQAAMSQIRGAPHAAENLPATLVFGTMGYSYYERTPFEEFNRIARARHGESFFDLPPAEQRELRDEFPDLWGASVRRGTQERQDYEMQAEVFRTAQENDDLSFLRGQMRREEWVSNHRGRVSQLAAVREFIFRDRPQREPETALDRYFEVINESRGDDLQPDWDHVDAWLAQQPEEDRAFIHDNTGVGRTALGRVYRQASRTYGEMLALPKYRGFTGAEAREIDLLWQEVRNHAVELAGEREVTRGMMGRAYRQIVGSDVPERIAQGVRRRIMGQLPQTQDRERFRQRHPESDLFFGRGTLTARQQQRLLDLVQREMRTHEEGPLRALLEGGAAGFDVPPVTDLPSREDTIRRIRELAR